MNSLAPSLGCFEVDYSPFFSPSRLPAMNGDSVCDAFRPAAQFTAPRVINPTVLVTFVVLLCGCFIRLSRTSVWQNCFFQTGPFLLVTYHTSLRSVSLKAVNGPENNEALSGHSFCFYDTECLEVQGQLGRLAGRVVEGGETKRQRVGEKKKKKKEGVGPIGAIVMRLICTTALNWLQQLINVLESWHKKFI